MSYNPPIQQVILRRVILLVCAVGALLVSSVPLAQAGIVYSWIGTTGDWSSTSNWSPTGHPSINDFAYIQNGGTAVVNNSPNDVNFVYIGTTAGAGNVNITGGSLYADYYEFVGYTGTGHLDQSAGGNYVDGELHVGYSATGTGTFDLSGTGLVQAYREYVGTSGSGTLTHTAGTNTVTTNLYVGAWSGSTGNYTLSGTGTLSAATEYISYSGSGLFAHSGGSNTVGGTLYVGMSSGSNGTYQLSGTGTLSTATEYIGNSGSGLFAHSGGSNTVGGTLYVGNSSGSSGTYQLSGTGTLSAATECIGYSGSGLFAHSSGSNTVGGGLYVGVSSGSNGTYQLSGTGTLSAPTEWIGSSGVGTFTQTGGTNTMASGQGLFLGMGSGSSGTYNLNGGVLTLGSLTKGAGTATFNFGSGALVASSSFESSVPMTLTATSQYGSIWPEGHSVELSGNLTGPGGLAIDDPGGVGVVTLSGTNTYAGDTLVNWGTLNVTGSVTSRVVVYPAGMLTGTGSVGSADVPYSGGRVAPGTDGTIGTLTVAGNMDLAADPSLLFDLDSPTSSDLISMAGSALSFDGLDLSDFAFTDVGTGLIAGTYVLIDAGSITGSLGSNLTGTLEGLLARLSISGNDVILTLGGSGAIPEPASLAIWVGCLLAAGVVHRRRRKSKSFRHR